jgi:tRNA (cmo5U34)-methyltransferase
MMSKNDIEEMSCFFDQRVESYDSHMIDELSLTEFYDEIEYCIELNRAPDIASSMKILDLGCGTGLELERVFKLHNDIKVTAIDISEKMLDKLKQKFKDNISNIEIICGSYFDVNFGTDNYDLVLSTYSLHHFTKDEKLTLYKRVYEVVKPGGKFINGDNTVKSVEDEKLFMEESKRIRKVQRMENRLYHSVACSRNQSIQKSGVRSQNSLIVFFEQFADFLQKKSSSCKRSFSSEISLYPISLIN